jgi:hypothetical protein
MTGSNSPPKKTFGGGGGLVLEMAAVPSQIPVERAFDKSVYF